MCECITADLDKTEFVQTQVTRTVDRKMIQRSNAEDVVESSPNPGEVLDTVDSNHSVEEDDLNDCASEWDDSTSTSLRISDPTSGEVADLVDDELDQRSTSKELEDRGSVPDGVLEQVADRLRIIGDEMDSDIRCNRMLGRRRAAGLPVRGLDVIVDLFPVPGGTSRKNLAVVVGDLTCETLARDLAHVTVRRALVAAGSAFAHALFRELILNRVTCPVDFRRKWSAIRWTRRSVG